MNDHHADHEHQDHEQSGPSQTQLYENLRRIGELEDQKQSIQSEIDRLTGELKAAVSQVDGDSLLYKMLTSALAPASSSKTATSRRRSAKKKTTKKKASRRKR